MPGGRFSRLLIYNCQARAGAFVRAAAILGVAHVLSVSWGSKGTAQQSRARSTIAKDREKTAAAPHAPTSRRASCSPNTRDKNQVCAGLDASARCRHYGIVLQQWIAIERTGCAGRG